MKIGHTGRLSSRYENKSLTDRSLTYYGVDEAPHASTIRASYTVPTGKKARVGAGGGAVMRYTVADTPSFVFMIISVGAFYASSVEHINNTVGQRECSIVDTDVIIPAGTLCQISTYDLSLGGSMNYLGGIAIIEFDD